MKVCPICGEVYRQQTERCHTHGVRLRTWRDASDQHAVVTDVDRSVVHGELHAPWRTPESVEAALAELVEVSDEPVEAPAPARGRVLAGRYRLSRPLGVGGYGAVFAADDLTTRERVAIKVLSPAATQSAELITRFHREAIAASRVRHPHIVDVADFDVDADGCQFIVMEYLDGCDLADALERAKRLPPARALLIAAQCARGLSAAHRAGVIHRDLKPANVFLVRRPDGSEAVKIIDFGISKLTRIAGDYTDVTRASKVVGTPSYMSPEQARGGALDARTDVYSLGVMLFEMLVGERPFTGRSPLEILLKHVDARRIPPSALRPELAAFPGLDSLVTRAIAAAPANRFRSMDELSIALVDCLRAVDPDAAEQVSEITGELTDPDDIAPAARPRSTSRRGLGAVAAIALVVVATFSFWPRDTREAGATGESVDRVAAPVPAAAAPPQPLDVPAPRAHVVHVTSTPSAATVLRDDVVIGVTPLDVELGPEVDAMALTLRSPGHIDRSISIDRDRSTVDVSLARRARATRREVPARAPKRPATRGVEEW